LAAVRPDRHSRAMTRSSAAGLLTAAVLLVLGAQAVPAAAIGFVPAAGSPFASGGTEPRSVSVGDFNGDAKADVAAVNTASSDVSVLLGDGQGHLAPGGRFPFSTNGKDPVASATGDLNGDHLADVVVANSTSGNITVLLGDPAGGLLLAPGFLTPAGVHPVSVAVADFNLDGRLDVAAANNGSANVSVLLGDGQGRLGPALGSPVSTGGIRPAGVTTGDFNGDGRPDVAAVNNGSGDVAVLLGDGQGRFGAGPGSPFSTGGTRPVAISSGDYNGDGKLDAVAVNNSSGDMSLLLGDARGGLRAASGSPFSTGGFRPLSVAVGDFNGDRRLDAAVVHQSGDLAILLGNGRGAFDPAAGSPFVTGGFHPASVANGDFNGDGRLDVTIAHTSGDVSLLLNAGLTTSSSCRILGRSARVSRSGVARIRVKCPVKLSGTLALQKGRKLTVGRKRFKITRAKRAKTVRVKLSGKGRRLVVRRKRLKVNATATATPPGLGKAGRTKTTKVITLRRR
jgi:FG-GAP-like repeat